jgi:hypothetical protein
MDSTDSFFITPVISASKIPILVLIRDYCYNKIPQKYIPPILSILVELISNVQEKSIDHGDLESEIVSSYFPSLLEVINSTENAIRSFFKSSSRTDMQKIEKDIRLISDNLLQELWNLNSYDDLYTILVLSSHLLIDPSDELKESLQKLKITSKPAKCLYSSSFLGSFVSVISIGAITMKFEEGLKVWKGFLDYRNESKAVWNSINEIEASIQSRPEFIFETEILPQAQVVKAKTRTHVYSHMDLSSLFQLQVSMLQKKSVPVSKSLQILLQSLSQSDRSLLPSSYHVEYLNSWRHADYDESFNALHRYFDYMMSNSKQYFYHYALLALATLHSSFGANKEALRAIDEAILVARENKDLDCLNYLLTWLLNFMITKPQFFTASQDHPSRSEIINFLRLKTKETKNLSLQAISFQFEVLICLLEGSDLTLVMENMIKTLYLILNFEDTDELKSIFITACQIADTVWKRVGYPAIGNLYLEIAIDFAKEKNNEFDLIILYLRKASDLFFTGEVDETFRILSSLKESALRDFSMSKKWRITHNIMDFYLNLNKCKYAQCSVLIEKMLSLSGNIDDQEITNELIYQRTLYNLRVNNLHESFSLLINQLNLMKENPLIFNNYWFIRFQVLYCHMFAEYTSHPQRGLSILLNAINLSYKSSLIFNLCECILCLCNLLLKSDFELSVQNVKDLLVEFLPKILEINKLNMVSEAYYYLARVEFAELQKSDDSSNFDALNNKTSTLLKYVNISIHGYDTMSDYQNLKKTLEFEKQIAEYLQMQELVTENISKLAKLELSIKSESCAPSF